MIGWSVTAIVLTILLTTKVGIRLEWKSGQALLKLRIGPFRFCLSTDRKEEKNEGSLKSDKPKEKVKSSSGKKWLRAVLAYWRELLELVGRTLRTPQLDLLDLRITVGGRDAEACAMNYGRICAGISGALPVVYGAFRLKKEDISVTCDFDRKDTEILAEVEATARIYEILVLVVAAVALLLKLYRHTQNNEKAVQSS